MGSSILIPPLSESCGAGSVTGVVAERILLSAGIRRSHPLG